MMLTVAQVAERLHIHPNTLRHWANEGKIAALRFPGRGDRRFLEEDIEHHLIKSRRLSLK